MSTVRSNSGVFWHSGQKGALLKYADTTTSKATTPLKSTTKVQILTDKNDNTKSSSSPNSKKGNYCAECGKKSQTLTRTKTGMPVCKECHSKFSKIKTKQPKSRTTEGDKLESKLSSAKPKTEATSNGGSLLDGTYDEEANAASFAEALAEWRNNGSNNNEVDGSTTNNTLGNSASCQTMTSKQRTNAVPEFHTSGSVTYLERLMIRRNRYDPKFLRDTVAVEEASTTTSPTSTIPLVEDILNTAAPTEYNVFYEAPMEHWNAPSSNTIPISTTNAQQPNSNTDLDNRHTPTSAVKPLAMQTAIRETWASKEDTGNLSKFFLSGMDENPTVTCVSEFQDNEKSQDVMLGRTTGTWKPEQSVVRNHNSLKPQDEDVSDSDDSDDALDLANCESDKEEWEMDDRITLECLERELQASQLGNNSEQEHQEINNHNSDFEETEREIQKDEQ